MLPATFLISFDCEGKWGIADRVSDREWTLFNNAQLNQAYQQLVQMLARYDIKATFAFVGAFTLSEEDYHEHQEWFACNGNEPVWDAWLSSFKRDAACGVFEGWLNPEALSIVSAHPEHEIAAHGFTHIPLHPSWISLAKFIHEMDCLKRLPVFQRDDLTFVYPRNLIGYTKHLKEYGYIAYREALQPDRSKLSGRMLNLMDAMNIFQPAHAHSEPEELVKVPPGFVLNWRHGIRKNIPRTITLKRWNHLLNYAIKHKRVVHLWTHPHNFVSGDGMYELLEAILREVHLAQKAGKIYNCTQGEYVRQFQNENTFSC